MEIQTDRLTVRPLRRDDWRDLLDYLSLPETYAFEPGEPIDDAAAFSPASTTANSSTLTITTGPTTLAGSYLLTVTGVSGSLTRTTTLTLVVAIGCVNGNGEC